LRLLLVDDERMVLRALFRFIKARRPEWEVRCDENAESALTRLSTWNADILVSDLSMPGMGGLEFLGVVRARYPRTRRLVYSAHTDRCGGSSLSGLASAALAKPARPEALLAMLERAELECGFAELAGVAKQSVGAR
jgi:two-component system response regulator YesN